VSLLAYNFRQIISKDKDYRMKKEATCEVGYPTGFLNFDFTNGSVIHVKSEEKNLDFNYYSVGVTDGSIVTFIGRSSSGKTTLVAQMAANIVRPFKTSCIFEDSVEVGLTWSRRENLSGFHDVELIKRYVVRNEGVNAENFYKRIKMIHDMKIADPKKYTYDTGMLDNFGNPLSKLEPTIYILDSIAMLMPENLTESEEAAGNMAGAQAAKVITGIFRTIVPMLKSANIILMTINHILDDPGAAMAKKKSSVAYLKQDETLPRGKTIIYVSNTMIRVDDVSKLKETEKYKFLGSIVDLTLVKSRTGGNKKTSMVFSQDKGFDPTMSLYLFLDQHDRVNGSGVGMYIDTHSEFKFSMANLKDKLIKNKDFEQIFMKAAQEELCKIPKLIFTNAEKEYAVSNTILDMCMQVRPKMEDVLSEADVNELLIDSALSDDDGDDDL
jgi:RecA/RadA recombinase